MWTALFPFINLSPQHPTPAAGSKLPCARCPSSENLPRSCTGAPAHSQDTSPDSRRNRPYNDFTWQFGLNTAWYSYSHFVGFTVSQIATGPSFRGPQALSKLPPRTLGTVQRMESPS